MVIAPDQFRDEEYQEPRKVLEEAGNEITVANSTGTESKGTLGLVVKPDIRLDQVKSEDYNAIIFVGGSGSSVYFENQIALDLAREFNSQEKIVAAICIAPTILVNAGILNGKKATCHSSVKNNISAVTTYTGSPVERDGNIITGSGPESAKLFGEKILEALQ
jgi:protease I